MITLVDKASSSDSAEACVLLQNTGDLKLSDSSRTVENLNSDSKDKTGCFDCSPCADICNKVSNFFCDLSSV